MVLSGGVFMLGDIFGLVCVCDMFIGGILLRSVVLSGGVFMGSVLCGVWGSLAW